MFGLPRLAPAPNGFCGADVDDGTGTGTPDGGVDFDDLSSFLAAYEPGDLAADLDDGSGLGIPDDGVDANDLLYFLTAFEEGTRGGDFAALRFAWRGYRWDKHLQLYHVRHRAFDPKLMVWLQPDPLGEIDGPNPYAYVGWDPFNRIDPYGLQARASEGFAFDPWAPVPIELITSLQDFRRLEDHARNSTDHSYTVRLRNNVDIIYTWNGTGWDAKKTTHDGQVIEAIQAAREGGAQAAARDVAAIGTTLETVLCVASEPVDWVMTVGAIAENPSDWTNYAGLLPFIPGAIRKADDVLGATGGIQKLKAVTEAATSVARPTRLLSFRDTRVLERSHLIDLNQLDDLRRSNLDRMREGLAPLDRSGDAVHLHHVDQQTDTPLLWLTQQEHRATPHPERFSEVHRPDFDAWREAYWKDYARRSTGCSTP